MKKNTVLLIAAVCSAGAAMADVIGSDDFDGNSTYESRTFNFTVNTAGATFDIVNRDTVLTTEIVDTSAFASAVVAFDATDALGYISSTDTDNFLGINRAGTTRALTYTFDISGYKDLSLSSDWIFGERWLSTLEVNAFIDSGSTSTIFSVEKDVANGALTMEGGATSTQNDTPGIWSDGTQLGVITDSWANYAANIAGTGDTLTLVVSQPGSFMGSLGMDNLVLNGTVIPEPATLGLVVAFGGGIIFVRRFMQI